MEALNIDNPANLSTRSYRSAARDRALEPLKSLAQDQPLAQTLKTTRIPTLPVAQWADVAESARSALVPLVVKGAFASTAQKGWTPAHLKEKYGRQTVNVVTNLPDHGVPYRERSDAHEQIMTMSDFLSLLERGEVCYLNQSPLQEYPSLEAALDLSALRLGRIHSMNLWVGSRTRSGLHFDNADNLIGQMFGIKRALLVSPGESRRLCAFPDNPSKSQIDPELPDFHRFPAFRNCEVWECELQTGDALFIPRGWWHHLIAKEVSVSINIWHGDSLTSAEMTSLFLAGGPAVVLRMVRDFVWHGILHRPYQGRLFSPPSPGVAGYKKLISQLQRGRHVN